MDRERTTCYFLLNTIRLNRGIRHFFPLSFPLSHISPSNDIRIGSGLEQLRYSPNNLDVFDFYFYPFLGKRHSVSSHLSTSNFPSPSEFHSFNNLSYRSPWARHWVKRRLPWRWRLLPPGKSPARRRAVIIDIALPTQEYERNNHS